ncbi:hypothetical protein BDM02DRAFT_1695468 [Thelephora ganbajun]|uniref:Uncharacterized protein n=1 Tax=Thelephora ganbajun TaxID=370292 RepID=A0ACB6ZK47_THEGA|nr:hypothetical protein BDM02DRAFT_1695468 [Thelephora ganbajun]
MYSSNPISTDASPLNYSDHPSILPILTEYPNRFALQHPDNPLRWTCGYIPFPEFPEFLFIVLSSTFFIFVICFCFRGSVRCLGVQIRLVGLWIYTIVSPVVLRVRSSTNLVALGLQRSPNDGRTRYIIYVYKTRVGMSLLVTGPRAFRE